VKFIHAADLHIDSPLRGLEVYDGAPLEQLRGATRVALQNLIRVAIEQAVDFVVIAGDLFDGKWQDMRTGLWTATQFRELDRANIRVFLLQGNHDAASKVRQAITWPDNVSVFSVKKPETKLVEELKVALHGQGFAREKVTTDLAAAYPDAVEGYFNIGVLHTSLTGSPEHDTYAPTTLSTLRARGYDYWALGHIHARSEPALSHEPYVAYCGNLQGRHIKETGAKGCLLVSVADGESPQIEFVATDTLRWQLVEVSLQPADGRSELLSAVEQCLNVAREEADGRLAAVRLVIRGACEVHREIAQESDRAEIVAEIRNLANDIPDDIWVEKVELDTTAPVDLSALLLGKDLLGELLRSLRAAGEEPGTLDELSGYLKPLQDKAALELRESGIDLDDPRQLARWLTQAEAMLVARLTESES
jgi:exonuclease SbcD